MSVRRVHAGFSLVEAIVAAAVLFLVCAAAAGALLSVLRAEDVLTDQALVERVVESERTRLAALPFCVTAPPPTTGVPWRDDPPSLLGSVFPHGLSHLNSPESLFQDEAGVAVFVTHAAVGGVDVESRAMFVRRWGSTWIPLSPAAVAGWAIWQTPAPPATTVDVLVTARVRGRVSWRRLRASALPAALGRAPRGKEVSGAS